MTDPSSQAAGNLTIPEELKKKFPELIALILGSESMNDEERQYWVNILPIMTPEQIENLNDILENEKKQLEEIDKKYSSQIDASSSMELIAKTEAARKKKRGELKASENEFEQEEEKQTEALLKKIQEL